ncbi:MAG TPA: type II secretion system protein [Burkholderiales bacterium]|nr:type II secretion system protein [Burkholderiales bacterium]
MKANQKGFTLVELIVVIVILGILAATALPKFVNLQSDARAASMKGLAGSMRASVELVRGRWLVTGSTSATTVTMADNTTVDVGTVAPAAGVPKGSATGIDRAAGIATTQYTCTGGPNALRTCTPVGGPAGCTVTYDDATGTVNDAGAAALTC